jgi:hypothetical protein
MSRPAHRPVTGPQLITYAGRLAGSLSGLTALLRSRLLRDAFRDVHILPFYQPYDGADAGFDPQDHTAVDSRLGAWADIRDLATSHTVVADVIVNHMSANAAPFQDVVDRGDASPSRGMFLTTSSVFPDGATEDDLARIYRPRPGLPFTAMNLGGRRRLVWTTFTADQIDLDIRDPGAWRYLSGIVDRFTDAGVTMLRLDAAGYIGKQAGTTCFLTDRRYLLARLTQLFLPGIPQIYYVGLLAGRNDVGLMRSTGVGRDINRRHYRPADVARDLERPVVRAQLAAIRMRANHPAFQGSFHHRLTDGTMTLAWRNGTAHAELSIDFGTLNHRLTTTIDGRSADTDDVLSLAGQRA